MARFCQNCGTELNDNQDVCLNCGVTVTKEKVNVNPDAKSKIAAGLLGIFLGTFGVHNFYLGYTNKAVTQLLISVLSCGMLAFISSIWGLIEGIMILIGNIDKDAKGNLLTD